MMEVEIDPGPGGSGRPREMRLAYMIAFFAAVLSVMDIGANKFRDREIVSVNRKMTAYGLYYNKTLKETLLQGERDLLQDLMRAGAIVPKDSTVILNRLASFDVELALIRRQQQEIIHGSDTLDSAQWGMRGINGERGDVKGINQWEYEVEVLDLAGDNFDLASLLLELSLVLGAIGFLTQSKQGRNLFKVVMVFFGMLGIVFGLIAYYQALSL